MAEDKFSGSFDSSSVPFASSGSLGVAQEDSSEKAFFAALKGPLFHKCFALKREVILLLSAMLRAGLTFMLRAESASEQIRRQRVAEFFIK